MESFPAFFPLDGRIVVIAGRGEAAEAKTRLFEGSPARVVRLSGSEALEPARYQGAALAFVADGDAAFVEGAARAARAAGTPVNVVDHPALCDFTSPAVIDRGEVVAAVGTGGASPMLAALLRNDIEVQIPEGAGRVAALFRQFQDEVRAALPDLSLRRGFLRDLLNGPAAQAALAGDMDGARLEMNRALADFRAKGESRAAGRVLIVIANAPSDLLSLRAVRALAQCDALLIEPDCASEIAGFARRDAERFALNDEAVKRAVELARQGRAVVWATAAAQPPVALIESLRREGVVFGTLASAPPEA
jgi:precorrin-2 dehydrogenase/sirohydrochlorin ferrochelatase